MEGFYSHTIQFREFCSKARKKFKAMVKVLAFIYTTLTIDRAEDY